jgi:hypothetical protein
LGALAAGRKGPPGLTRNTGGPPLRPRPGNHPRADTPRAAQTLTQNRRGTAARTGRSSRSPSGRHAGFSPAGLPVHATGRAHPRESPLSPHPPKRCPTVVAAPARATGFPAHQLSTPPHTGAQPLSPESSGRGPPRCAGAAEQNSRHWWRTVVAFRARPAAKKALTAGLAHDRASTLPLLPKAHTRAWGLLHCGRGLVTTSVH